MTGVKFIVWTLWQVWHKLHEHCDKCEVTCIYFVTGVKWMTSSPSWWLCSNLGWSAAKPSSLSTQLTTATSKSVEGLLVHCSMVMSQCVHNQSVSQSVFYFMSVHVCTLFSVQRGTGTPRSCLVEFWRFLQAALWCFMWLKKIFLWNHLSLVNLGCLTTGAVVPIPITVCRIVGCSNNGVIDSVWDF